MRLHLLRSQHARDDVVPESRTWDGVGSKPEATAVIHAMRAGDVAGDGQLAQTA